MNDQSLAERMQERYQRLSWALLECFDKNVSKESMDTLMFETGFLKQDFDKLQEKAE